MFISWLGLSAFKIETKEAVLVTDPFSPRVAKKPLRAKADVVTVSNPLSDVHNHLSGIQGTPFVIDHPGEFEVKGVFIQGLPVAGGETERVLYTMDIEGMRLAHLGSVRKGELAATVMEKMNGVDVLFLPVGGGDALDAEAAAALLHDIEPRIVVPMQFAQEGVKVDGKLAPVSAFLKELGSSSVKPVDRVSLKKRDLTNEEMSVIVFQP